MHLTTIEEIKDYLPHTYDCVDNVSNKEIIDKIQLGLTWDIRKIYLKMQSGIKICKSDMEKLVNAIKEILDA